MYVEQLHVELFIFFFFNSFFFNIQTADMSIKCQKVILCLYLYSIWLLRVPAMESTIVMVSFWLFVYVNTESAGNAKLKLD